MASRGTLSDSNYQFHIINYKFFSFILCLLFAGCAGYHVGPVKPTFMLGINTIAVPTFRNLTLIPRIEVMASDTLIRQIQEDGTYKVASSVNDADAVLEGEITQVLRRPSRTVLGDVLATEEFEMTITIHYRVIRRATGELVDDRSTNGTTSFFVSGDVNQDEKQAFPLAAQSAATHIISDIGEGW
jgi:hypothetical protein